MRSSLVRRIGKPAKRGVLRELYNVGFALRSPIYAGFGGGMNCEIELLPVGDGEKGGDAIVIRYGTEQNYSLMILVDGGTQESGDAIVAHVRRHFPGKSIEHVILTHADQDHASGLRTVLRELTVNNLWLHQPWDYAADALPYFANKSMTVAGLQRSLKSEYSIVRELVEIAAEKSVRVRAPFTGDIVGPFTVLSPSKAVYTVLLPQFDRSPDPDVEMIKRTGWWVGKAAIPSAFNAALNKLAEFVQKFVPESWEGERLRNGGTTSATNESSIVLYGTDPTPSLLTGDAGLRALGAAADAADTLNLPLKQFEFVQVPHHGSRSNVGPDILNRIVGPILPRSTTSGLSAFVSAPKDDAVHPRKMVTNAFMRRGATVVATQGNSKVRWGGFLPRQGYSAATGMAFQTMVEEYD